MILTEQNYHSREANLAFMSVSQYKSFDMENGGCEAATMAELSGEYDREDREAFLVGSYVHAWAEGRLPEFIDRNQAAIFKKSGGKYAAFEQADRMIETLSADKFVMYTLTGEHEIFVTAEFGGVPWKARLDVINRERGYFAELKTARSISEAGWMVQDGKNVRVSFIEQYNYLVQAAMYQEIERLACGRENPLEPVMVVVTKESPPDHAVISLNDPDRLAAEREAVLSKLPRIIAVKTGAEPPERCEKCAYCRATKQVSRVIHYTELTPA